MHDIKDPDVDLDSAMTNWAYHINWALGLEPVHCERCGVYYHGEHLLEICDTTVVKNVMAA